MGRLLVLRGGAVGDFILTLPVLRMLREQLPEPHLEVLGYPGIVDLARTAGLAEAVGNLEHRTLAPLFAPGVEPDPTLATWFASFDLVISYLHDPDGHFRANLKEMGVETLIQCPHRVVEGQGPASRQLAKPLESLALFLEHPCPAIHPDVPAVDPSPRRLFLHPGSGSLRKTWSAERWLSVMQQVRESHPSIHITLLTGEAERDRGIYETVTSGPWQQLVDEHWHELRLPDLAERLRAHHGHSQFVGHDSGISHLAAACGLPCLLLFGPTDPATWAPPHEGITVIHQPGDDVNGIEEATVREATVAALNALT